MEDESKLGQILCEVGLKKQNGSAAIHPIPSGMGLPANFRYTGLNSLLDAHINLGEEELIVKITKIKDSNVYSCDIYKKE